MPAQKQKELTLPKKIISLPTAAGDQKIDRDSSIISDKEIEDKIAYYEQLFGMRSEEFLQQKREGTALDTREPMAWTILLQCQS